MTAAYVYESAHSLSLRVLLVLASALMLGCGDGRSESHENVAELVSATSKAHRRDRDRHDYHDHRDYHEHRDCRDDHEHPPQSCVGLEGSASLTQKPYLASDYEATISGARSFSIPSRFTVSKGAPAKAKLTLAYAVGNSPPSTCSYGGNGSPKGGGSAYVFESCTSGVKPGRTFRADHVIVHLHGADPKLPKTVVEVDLHELKPCVGCLPVDDGNPCTLDGCGPGGPTHAPMPDGTDCSNGNACDGSELCNSVGQCMAGTPVVCSALDECHQPGSCQPATGECTDPPSPAGTDCSDDDACNGAEACDGTGSCMPGTPLPLPISTICASYSCEPAVGVVTQPAPNGVDCDNGDECDGVATCDGAGTCALGIPPTLDDGNPCTSDACNALDGVTHDPLPVGTSCADLDACDGPEACDAVGECVGPEPSTGEAATGALARTSWQMHDGEGLMPFGFSAPAYGHESEYDFATVPSADHVSWISAPDADTIAFNGGTSSLCGVADCRSAGQFTYFQSFVNVPPHIEVTSFTIAFSGIDDGVRTTIYNSLYPDGVVIPGSYVYLGGSGTANLASLVKRGEINRVVVTHVDDCCSGSYLSSAQVVLNGTVVGTGPVAPWLDDGNPCTIDSCSLEAGIQHLPAPAGSNCSDSDVCNGAESCDGQGACLVGAAPLLDDGNPCTTDACDPVAGVTHEAAPAGVSCGTEQCALGASGFQVNVTADAGAGLAAFEARQGLLKIFDWSAYAPPSLYVPGALGPSVGSGSFASTDAEAHPNTVTGSLNVRNWVDGEAFDTDDGNAAADLAINGPEDFTVELGTPRRALAFAVVTGQGNQASEFNPDGASFRLEARDAANTLLGSHEFTLAAGAATEAWVTVLSPLPFSKLTVVETGSRGVADQYFGTLWTGDCLFAGPCVETATCDGAGQCQSEPVVLDDGNPCTVDTCDPLVGVQHTPALLGTSCSDAEACNGQELCDGRGACERLLPNTGQLAWVDWTSNEAGVVSGHAGALQLDYTGEQSAGVILGGSENYWAASSSTYTSPPIVLNPPPSSDIIRIVGGSTQVNALRFSRPVVDPVMGVVSLGAGGTARFDFIDAPFRILNNGPGHWGNGPLTRLPGDILEGREGHGLIQFEGVFTEIRWTNPIAENWYGFTFAVHETGAASCDDGNACNGVETCSDAGCVAGPPPSLDDGNPCTVDSCDPSLGVRHEPAPGGERGVLYTVSRQGAESTNEIFVYGQTELGGWDLFNTISNSSLGTPALNAPVALLVLDDGDLLLTNSDLSDPVHPTGSVSRLKFPFANPFVVSVNAGPAFKTPHWIARAGEFAYIAQRFGQDVLRLPISGSGEPVRVASVTDTTARGITVTPWGEFFVSRCCGVDRVDRFLLGPDGQLVPNGSISGNGLSNPHDMEFSPWGEMFVANAGNGSVSRFRFDASHASTPNGVLGGGMTGPIGLAFTAGEDLFVASHDTQAIYHWRFDANHQASQQQALTGPESRGDIAFACVGGGNNEPPAVDAGPDQAMSGAELGVVLAGRVGDDGLPQNLLTSVWSAVGPGNVTFGDSSNPKTLATFSAPGAYTLRLEVSDGELFASDEVTMLVGETPTCTPAPAGLAHWWPANDDYLDHAGEADAIAKPEVPLGPGKVGNAFAFTSSGERLELTRPLQTLSEQFSIELWFNPSQDILPSDQRAPLFLVNGFGNTVGIANASIIDGTWHGEIEVRGPLPRPTSVANTWLAGAWHHVVVTFDHGVYRIFVNGQLDTEASSAASILGAPTQAYLGGFPGRPETYFFGGLDELSIYARALGADEVHALYESDGSGKCAAGNAPPLVNAGPDVVALVASQVPLLGSVIDDGLPLGASLTSTWSQIAGPGLVTLTDGHVPVTSVSSLVTGRHSLRLVGNDSALSASDDMLLCLSPPNERFADDFEDGAITSLRRFDVGCCVGGFVGELDGVLRLGTGSTVSPGASEHKFFATRSTFSPVDGGVTATARIRFNGDYQGFAFGEENNHLLVRDGLHLAFNTFARREGGDAGREHHVRVVADTVGRNTRTSIANIEVPVTWYEWHDFTIEWLPTEARFLIDGELVATVAVPVGCNEEVSLVNARPLQMDTDWLVVDALNTSSNVPPTVDVGPDLAVTLPETASLHADVSDTSASVPQIAWSKISGPGTVAFTAADHASTQASFSASGQYVLRAQAFDGEFHARDELTVMVSTLNQAPNVNAGMDLTVQLPGAAQLSGTVDDDGLPSTTLTSVWTQVSGPALATIATPSAEATSVAFTVAGSYVFRLTATDSTSSASDEVTVTVNEPTSPVNQPPVVDAGPDLIAFANEGISIDGSFTDDGLPIGGAISIQWFSSGPPFPLVVDDTQLTLEAMFETPGTYQLMLRVNDGELFADDIVVVEVAPQENEAPVVNAGADRTITLPVNALTLTGSFTDDGLPAGAGVATTWSQSSGPAPASIAAPGALSTSISFPAAGTYVFALDANDTALGGTDTVSVLVRPDPNQAPVVTVLGDSIADIELGVALGANVSDDGRPVGAALTFEWQKVSGPGDVTFWTPNAIDTIAQFSVGGPYTLRLVVGDSVLSGFDYHEVLVSDGEGPVVAITAPTDGDSVTAPSNVLGSVTSETLESWELELREVGQSDFHAFASGTTEVSDGALGVLDPSLLLNGQYEVRLTATDTIGRVASASQDIVVEGNLKVGNFTVSFKDLSVPVAGIPIEVIRTYDSRNKQRGDFGVGWTLDINTLKVQKNRIIGQNWQTEVYPGAGGFGFLTAYCVVPGKRRYVTLTFADGKVFRFEAKVIAPGAGWNGRRECQLGAEFSTAHVEFQPLPGTHASLTRTGGTDVIVDAAWPGEATLYSADDGSTLFDPDKFVVTLHDGRQLSVAQATGLEQVRDTNGNVLQIRPEGLLHSSGRSISFLRDDEGRIESILDPEGNTLSYEYDSNGDLQAFTNTVSETTEYAYDGRHYLLGIVDPRGIQPLTNTYDPAGRLLSHTDALGNEISYHHDLVNRREEVCDRLGNCTRHEYDDRGNVLRTLDALGNATTYSYDDRDNKLSECNALSQCSTFTYDDDDNRRTEKDALGNQTEYTYDGQGNVLTVRDALGRLTSNEYDSRGNLTQTTDPVGNVTSYVYNAQGLQSSMTDALLNTTSYGYDSSGNLLAETDALGRVTRHTYDLNGNRRTQTTTRTTPSGVETLVTSYEYDPLNRLVKTTLPDGSTSQTEYNVIGQQAASIDPLGRRTELAYDEMGRIVSTSYADGTTETTSYDAEGRRSATKDRADRITGFEYDAVGRLTRTLLPDGSFTSTGYDAAGRTVTTTDEAGSSTTFAYDAAGRRLQTMNALGAVTSFSYDEAGNQLALTDPLGHETVYAYDTLNRRTEVLYVDGTFETTEYDVLGRRTAKIDQAGVRTEYGYDALGRLISVTDALGGVTSYGYDEAGNQLTQTDALGRVTRFAYDALGRRTQRRLPPAPPSAAGALESMSYDAGGNLSSKTDFMGRTITYDYDVNSRLIAKHYPDGTAVGFSYTPSGRRATATDARGVTSYDYDVRDRLTSLTYPDGRKLEYDYDARGARTLLRAIVGTTTLDTTYAYDAAGRLIGVRDPNGKDYTYGYDLAGNKTSLDQPNGTHTTYAYDALNRLTNLTTVHVPSSNVIQSYAYTLGATGIRTRIDEADGTARAYTYDNLYRLTGEEVTGSATDYTKSFTYDAVGNRLKQTTTGFGAAIVDYTYDARDRLLSENAMSSTWDENGNLTSRAADSEYSWDFEDRLVSVTKVDGTRVDYGYDADGIRVHARSRALVVPEVTTAYLVDTSNSLSHVVAESHGVASVAMAYYLRAGDQMVAVGRGPDTRYYHADALGSVRRLTDSTGAATDAYAYTAFGEPIAWSGGDPQPYRFAGEARGSDSLYNLRSRQLDVTRGRFVSRDPIDGPSRSSIANNDYAYANAIPTMLTDPQGLFVPVVDLTGSVSQALLEYQKTSRSQLTTRKGAWRVEKTSWSAADQDGLRDFVVDSSHELIDRYGDEHVVGPGDGWTGLDCADFVLRMLTKFAVRRKLPLLLRQDGNTYLDSGAPSSLRGFLGLASDFRAEALIRENIFQKGATTESGLSVLGERGDILFKPGTSGHIGYLVGWLGNRITFVDGSQYRRSNGLQAVVWHQERLLSDVWSPGRGSIAQVVPRFGWWKPHVFGR